MFPGLEKKGPNFPKVSMINSFEDVCNYMKSSSELADYTTLGIDKKNFKSALHKILKFVSCRVNPDQEASLREVRGESYEKFDMPHRPFHGPYRAKHLQLRLKPHVSRGADKETHDERLFLLHEV